MLKLEIKVCQMQTETKEYMKNYYCERKNLLNDLIVLKSQKIFCLVSNFWDQIFFKFKKFKNKWDF